MFAQGDVAELELGAHRAAEGLDVLLGRVEAGAGVVDVGEHRGAAQQAGDQPVAVARVANCRGCSRRRSGSKKLSVGSISIVPRAAQMSRL